MFRYTITIIGTAFSVGTFITNRISLSERQKSISYLVQGFFLIFLFGVFETRIWYVGIALLIASVYVFATNIHYKEQNIPISTEEWIKYLSEKAGVSEYYVAYGYQYLRSVAYWIYQAWDLKNTPEKLAEINMTEEDQQEICKWISEKDFSKLKDWIFQNE